MADFRSKGPKRPIKVLYIIAAVIFAIIVIMLVGRNMEHSEDVEQMRGQGTSPDAPAEAPPAAP